jgi:hypothetical protein
LLIINNYNKRILIILIERGERGFLKLKSSTCPLVHTVIDSFDIEVTKFTAKKRGASHTTRKLMRSLTLL